jgi:hypothetical protein
MTRNVPKNIESTGSCYNSILCLFRPVKSFKLRQVVERPQAFQCYISKPVGVANDVKTEVFIYIVVAAGSIVLRVWVTQSAFSFVLQSQTWLVTFSILTSFLTDMLPSHAESHTPGRAQSCSDLWITQSDNASSEC